MTKEELKDKALGLIQSSWNGMNSLQIDRERYLRYYNGDKGLYDTVEGRSSVVTNDVHDVVEGILPALMDIFYGGADVVKCTPQGPEDEEASKLMEELLNYQFQRTMNGFRILHDWFKSSLIMETAWVKYWWETGEDRIEKTYSDINLYEYQSLLDQPDLEIIKVTTTNSPDHIEGMIIDLGATYTVKCVKIERYSRPKVEYVPEEEIIHSVYEKSTDNCTFIAHRKRVHKSTLAKYGVDEETTNSYTENFTNDVLYMERFADLGGMAFWSDEENEDFVYICECYMDDYDKDGNSIPKKLVIYGNELLEMTDNNYRKPPFIPLSPYIMPGRMLGHGLASKATEYQDVSTTLTRSGLDNIYYQNLGMKVVNEFRIRTDDLLEGNRPGGVVRTLDDIDPNTAIYAIPTTTMPGHYPMMVEQNEARKENHTGINKYSMGTDSREVNRTATGVAMLTSAAQMRTKHIARTFAETGVKALFCAMRDMNLEFLDMSYNVRLNERWARIDRNSINGAMDIMVDVGLGTGTKELKANQMMQSMQFLMPMVQGGLLMPDAAIETLKELYQNWGYKNPDRFVIPGPLVAQSHQMAQQGPMGQNGPPNAMAQGPQGQPGTSGTPNGMEGGGSGQDSQPRIDPRVLRAVQAVMPQPVASN